MSKEFQGELSNWGCAARWQSNPDVAAALFLSRNTVQTHVSHISAKLGARSRAEIIGAAMRHPATPYTAST